MTGDTGLAAHQFQNQVPTYKVIRYVQGVSKVFRHLKLAVCGELVHIKNFLRKYQMKVCIIPTLSENFNEIRRTWHQVQPQT